MLMDLTRRWWIGGAAALGGCSILPAQPLTERRQWPLEARRRARAEPRAHGPVLLVRTVQPGPGLTQRGLQWLRPDGSLLVDFYEQWAVPPAQASDGALRQWLADSGAFSAVTGPGSRMKPDFALEATLTALLIDLKAEVARAVLGIVVLDERGAASRVLAQETLRAEVRFVAADVPQVVRASVEAVTDLLAQAEAVVIRVTEKRGG